MSDGKSEKMYHDSNGDERTLYGMVRDEREWACSRIREGEKAIEEVKRLVEASTWRPIESAPKDGEYIMVYDKGSGCFLAYWSDTDCWRQPSGYAFYNITHWMPLPAAPEGGES